MSQSPRRFFSAVCLVASVWIGHPIVAQPTANTPPVAPAKRASPDASAALEKLLDEHVEWLLKEDSFEAVRRRDEPSLGMIRDESPEAYVQRLSDVKDRARRLREIDASALSEAQRVDADLLAYELDRYIKGAAFHGEQMPLDARNGPQIGLPQLGISLPLHSRREYEGYVTVLEKIPAYIDQTIEQMKLGIKAGRVPPRVTMLGTVEQARALAAADIAAKPTASPFFDPVRSRSESDPVVARAKAAIAGGIVPAFARLAEFLEKEYIPACRESVAASESVDGIAAYTFALEGHTTTKLTPDEVHQIGVAEVARIRAEMFQVIARTDFPQRDELKGDELFAAFVAYLRTNPRFYYTDSEALLRDYRDLCKRVDAELPGLFGKLPRNAYGVKEMPALGAPSSPSAYYYPGSIKGGVPGYFIVNTYKPDQRPKYEMRALALHEAVPGHHLQIALAQELENVHPFHTFIGYTAFVEGWALYAEHLGLEMSDDAASHTSEQHEDADAIKQNETGALGKIMPVGGHGIYTDPYDDFGRLSFEMWRACRLVVDTGIHAKGWTRKQAIDFMLSNTALSALNIEREVDRYIGWPGQACGYKIGEIKIRELRTRAEKALGESFDRRAFHDAVLGVGAVPLPVLEARIDRWIAAGGKEP